MNVTRKGASLVFYRAISEIVGKVSMLIVTVAAARRLSHPAFGVFSLASVLGTFVGLATDFGIPLHVARAVAQRPSDAPAILKRWLTVRIGTSAMISVLVILGVLSSAPSRAYALPIILFTLAYVLSALIDFLHYFYRGIGRSDVESSLTLWQRTAMVIAGLTALWWTNSLNVLAMVTLAPVLATFAFSAWFARRLANQLLPRHGSRPALVPFATEFWCDVFPIGAGMLLSALYFRIDVFLVGEWRGVEAVGLYNAAFRLLEGVRLLPAAVMAVVLPRLCRATDARPFRQVSVALTLFGLLIALISWFGADWMVSVVYGRAYTDASGAFRILMVSFPLMSLNAVLTQQLIGWHGQRTYAVVCALALGFNLALNVWLVAAHGIEGAAWATLWTEVLVTIGCAWGLRTHLSELSQRSEIIFATR